MILNKNTNRKNTSSSSSWLIFTLEMPSSSSPFMYPQSVIHILVLPRFSSWPHFALALRRHQQLKHCCFSFCLFLFWTSLFFESDDIASIFFFAIDYCLSPFCRVTSILCLNFVQLKNDLAPRVKSILHWAQTLIYL